KGEALEIPHSPEKEPVSCLTDWHYSIISPYFYIRSDRDLQGDAELKITGFLIGFCIVQLKQ
ncbi:hypothetical protein OU532_24745, partial [Escherichia coli]|nr:hypothetical protein [Escherichia coli]